MESEKRAMLVLVLAVEISLLFGSVSARDVSSVISKDFFDAILNATKDSCAGKKLYNYGSFVQAADAYSGFGITGSSDDAKRELAAFFAHVTQETGSMCNTEEMNRTSKDYCNETYTEYPCVKGKSYFGRGPIMLFWNYNYGQAGKDIGFDGLNEPEKVANDAAISFKTAAWFWMKNSNCHMAMTSGQGFGATIQAVNGAVECGGREPDAVNMRIRYYKSYCDKLGVDPGSNLSC